MPYREAGESGVDWRDGFAAAGLNAVAGVSFDLILRSLVASRKGSLDVRWPGCPRLGADEAWLLDCLSLLQQQRGSEAVARMSMWLSPAVTRIIHAPLSRFAELMAENGLILPARDLPSDGAMSLADAYCRSDPALLLVH